jgi:protein-L-isoaspartate(D-aspartate) O-methyltransferase
MRLTGSAADIAGKFIFACPHLAVRLAHRVWASSQEGRLMVNELRLNGHRIHPGSPLLRGRPILLSRPRTRTARQFYAEELRFTANISSRAVIDAFATVPRECFVGPGPWRILSPMRMGGYWTTADADPRHVYHDVLIALDEARGINNGQPSLWAKLYDRLNLSAGAHVVHVGAGAGYYSAVLAEIVGLSGHVTAIEIDPDLAGRARNNLVSWPQASVIVADGFAFHGDRPANAIVVNAGVTHVSMTWLDML